MSAEELGWIHPNQTYSIPSQLKRGARAMLIDTYYAKPDQSVPAAFKYKMFPPPSRENGSAAGATMYLCHVTCQWGASELIPEFRKVRDFLAKNPREVMVFVNEDNVTPSDFARAVEESGLIDFTYKGSTENWPTLQQMIDSNQRVVFLAEQQAAGVDWYHKAYDGPLQETDYSFDRLPSKWGKDPAAPESPTYTGVDKLTDPALLARSCDPNRGDTSGDLFLMNHWVSGGLPLTPLAPDPALAEVVNTRQVLVDRARACETVRGEMPTILAVDFFDIGDVVGAARELNGVEAKPFLTISRPRPARTRAGRVARLRVTVSNDGDGAASSLRICATAPRRLVRRTSCRSVGTLQPGTRRTTVISLRTSSRARGRGAVRILMRTSLRPLGTSTALTVTPVRRARGR
jgi:hypothetical protein